MDEQVIEVGPADEREPERFIVVESGAKTKTIRRFLRGEYSLVASGGGITELPGDELGIDVEDEFEWQSEPIKYRGRNKVEQLAERLRDADEVYIATDPDREGEAIAADILQHCVPPDARVKRITFNAIV